METDKAARLQERLLDLLSATGHRPLRVRQIASILGITDESEVAALRQQLRHSSSHRLCYNAQGDTVCSLLNPSEEREKEEGEDNEEDRTEAPILLSSADARGRSVENDSSTAIELHQRNRHGREEEEEQGETYPRQRPQPAPIHPPHHRSLSQRSSHQRGGYRSDQGYHGDSRSGAASAYPAPGPMSRRRLAGGAWSKAGQRALEDAGASGGVGRVGYVCVADELHLGTLEAYYSAQGYYTKFDFDVLHVRFAQTSPIGATTTSASLGDVRVSSEASSSAAAVRDRVRGRRGTGSALSNSSSTPLPQQQQPEEQKEEQGVNAWDSVSGLDATETASAGGNQNLTHRNYGATRSAPAATGDGGEAAIGRESTHTTRVQHGFDLFIFPYGAIVWWGFDQRYFKIVEQDYLLPHSAIGHCMTNRYTTQLVNENYPVWCTYSLVRRDTLEVDDDFRARLRFDHFVLPYSRGEVATGSVLMLCASHALAQSAKIDYLELQVQALADGCSPLPRELREKGTVSIKERRLLQLRGEVLSYRLMLKSGSDLLDEPDFFWENAYLKPVFQATKAEFAIAERVEALDNKLDAANEILSMLADDFSQRHGARLEWIVIWLVFVEVVIGVLELLVDIRPWVRAK